MFSSKCAAKSMIQYKERRHGTRLPPSTEIEIAVGEPAPKKFRAALKDVQNHGFAIVYEGPTLASGTEFEFQAGSIRGRARLISSRYADGRNEAGCVVLAD